MQNSFIFVKPRKREGDIMTIKCLGTTRILHARLTHESLPFPPTSTRHPNPASVEGKLNKIREHVLNIVGAEIE